MEQINLEDILKKHSNICIDDREDVIIAMEEACKQTLELAAENATIVRDIFKQETEVDKQSILDTINQIKK